MFVVQVQQVRVLAARTQSSSHSYSPFLGPGRSHARCVQRLMPMVDVLMQFIDLGDVAVMPQRPVPAVGLNSWNEGYFFRALLTGAGPGVVSQGHGHRS